MYSIKFGTDGWREIIADNFTNENVRRIAKATADYMNNSNLERSCVVGYDCRFGGAMFAGETATVLAENGIKVILSSGFVSTPMISLAAKKRNTGLGIIITASHNPPTYNGYKVKAGYGGPATQSVIEALEKMIPQGPVAKGSFQDQVHKGNIVVEDIEALYLRHVEENFDMGALRKMAPHLVYDAMYGAGQNVIKKLLPGARLLHAEYNPGFNGRAPEPILKNLPEITEHIKNDPDLYCGLATDGDADRIGFFDEKGNFVDSHNLILLLTEYLTTYKKLSGKVVKSFSVSDRVEKLCKLKGLETVTTKIGFKYICEYMVTDDVLIGAEESGGIAIKGHIPERDGVWMGLVIMEYMAKTGKSVSQLIQDIYDNIGGFAVERYDLHLNEDLKEKIVNACKNNEYEKFADLKVQSLEMVDGYKFRFSPESWVMIRPSGTEPVLRVYAEASSSDEAYSILDKVKGTILNGSI